MRSCRHVLLLVALSVVNVASFIPPTTKQRELCKGTLNGLSVLRDDGDDELPIVLSPRKRQIRRRSKHRRPNAYWNNAANVKEELRLFWTNLHVQIPAGKPPPIPNESLLNHFGRHDLRSAIVSHGGRDVLAMELGGSTIMAGKWSDAVATSDELKQLLENETHGLTRELPPLSPQQKKHSKKYTISKRITVPQKDGEKTIRTDAKRWSRQQGRKPKGYWNIQFVIEDLYDYLDASQENTGRPAVWMPRPSELEANGRRDLMLAMSRLGGAKKICQIAGLVPYRDWHYFEGQLELMVELERYLKKHCNGDLEVFPSVTDVKHNGHDQLHRLVQHYGGKKYVANRLGLRVDTKMPPSFSPMRLDSDGQYQDLDWGKFSLEFGIRLLSFIRAEELKKKAPLRYPAIYMPCRTKLRTSEIGRQLDEGIKEYGGYENVARRLGLAYQ